jgi:tripartite-type tricarboxylate transporter receptor subunit TctC
VSKVLLLLMLACTQLLASLAHAQSDWPNRPIRIIVPTPPGGAYDKIIRPIAQDMSVTLKQPIVIENRPSAGNIVGSALAAQAPADGYTFLMSGMMNTMAASLYEKVPFDINKDFVHLGSLGGGGQWLVVRSDLGINSLQQLIDEARKNPGKLNYATSGAGSTGHLIMEQLQKLANIKLTHVPYKGGAPALLDVLAGVVGVMVVPPAGADVHVKAGKLKVLAVSTEQRASTHPDIPSFAEQGYKGLTAVSYAGLSAPKGLSPDIANRFYAAMKATTDKPAIRAQLLLDGVMPIFHNPQEYTNLLLSDTERWGQLIRALDLKAQ